ncbi:MAG: zeta toxin family protein [Eubacteriales bacterium]
MMKNNPQFVVFAGVNGAGKTSIYRKIFKEDFPELGTRINPDEVIHSFQGNWKNTEDQIRSGKLCLKMQKDYFEQGISFHRETTFSSREIIKSIHKALNLDYEVTIYFVHLESVDIAVERVAKRVREGGHGISNQDVTRRFVRSVDNIVETAKNSPVNIYFYDNTGHSPMVVGQCRKGHCESFVNLPWLEEIYKKIEQNI